MRMEGPGIMPPQENPESFESELNGIYQRDYLDALPEVLNKKFVSESGEPIFSSDDGEYFDSLQGLTDHLLSSAEPSNPESQEKIVKTLIENMKRIPSGQSMSVRHAAETGKMYCSVSAATFQLMMEKIQPQLGVKSEYVSPVDHAANVVRIGNKIFFADPRNGIFDDITANLTEEYRGGLKIYRAKSGGIFSDKTLFSIIPAMTDSSKSMVHADMGNFEGMVDFARGKFGEDSERMGMDIAQKLQNYAKEYLAKLGILGDKEKEDAFTKKYSELDEASGKEMDEFKRTEEFKAEERRVSVDNVMSDEWKKVPDEVKKSLLATEQFQSFLVSGDRNEILRVTADNQEILKSLEAIREAFGIRWIISNISTDEGKIADLKPYMDRAKNNLGIE